MSDLLERAKSTLPQTEGELNVLGLENDVEVIRDGYGIPHIYAENLLDLFLANGYVTAQDRLWQMELTRRSAGGTMSEIFGEAMLKSDLFYRNIGLNRTAERLAQRAGEEHKGEHIEILGAYCAGINEYISHNRDTLPLGFHLLQFSPEEFTIRDNILFLLAVSFGLTATSFVKLVRLKLIEKLGEEAASLLFPVGRMPSFAAQSEYGLGLLQGNSGGSNNWVVSGEKSITGKPLLANDPHLFLTIPGIWYETHLCAPDLNAVGFSIPGIPGITIGHNESIGWGYTNSCADVQDIYIEKANPENPEEYLNNDRWINFDTVEEEIEIRGKEPLIKEFQLSNHGPILESFPMGFGGIGFFPIEDKFKLAYKSIEHDVDVVETFAAVSLLNRAQNWVEFKKALEHWVVPSQNVVYADIEGNVGYLMSGRVPIRKRGQGVVPVPGWKQEYEWEEYIPFEEMPCSFNPKTNFIATANNKVIPPDYPYLISHFFSYPDRFQRISELLLEKHKLSLDDFKRIQLDLFSRRAREISQYLIKVPPQNERQSEAIEVLKRWDYRMEVDSSAALIYYVWSRKSLQILLKERLGNELYTLFMMGSANLLYFLKYPFRWLYAGTSQSNLTNRNKLLSDSLELALEELSEKHGSNIEKWKWGLEHHITFTHPLSRIHPDLQSLNRGPIELPGDRFTVNLFPATPISGYRCLGGVSCRMILDFSDLRNSIAVAPPGQSGHPLSQHYADMIDPWVRGEHHPMLFARADVEKEKKATLTLHPG